MWVEKKARREKKHKKSLSWKNKPRLDESLFDFSFVSADIDEKEINFDGSE